MIKTSNSNTNSKGFILFPIMIMLLSASLILMGLSQEFYNHIRLVKETKLYFNAQSEVNTIIPKVETDLNLHMDDPTPATPIDQEQLLSHINTWPKLNANTSVYSQRTHTQKQNIFYQSLINVSDNLAQQRASFELLSICTLADHRCRPVELTLMQ